MKEGDIVRCDDGANYTITDMSRYDASAFASGPLGPLPTAACDRSGFPEAGLPAVEVRRFNNEAGDYDSLMLFDDQCKSGRFIKRHWVSPGFKKWVPNCPSSHFIFTDLHRCGHCKNTISQLSIVSFN